MKKLLTTACLFVVTTVAIVSFIAPSGFGQGKKTAKVVGSEVSKSIPAMVEWRFSEPQPDWKPTLPLLLSKTVELERTTDALRVTLSEGSRISPSSLAGGVYIDLPDWRREEWAEVVVRARTTGSVNNMSIGLNPRESVPPAGAVPQRFQARGGVTPIVRDGLVHTYRIHLDWGSQRTGPWRRVGLWFQAPAPASIDILSVRVVPATGEQLTETMLEPQQVKSDFALFRKALEEAHPALYRFTTKRAMDAEFARAEAKLARPMTLLQFRKVMAPVLGAIKSGGGIGRYQGDEISALIASSKLFPLALTFDSTRAFVVLNRGRDERVRPGMEVRAINGQSLAETLRRILPNLLQDGDVRTRQMYELGSSDFVRPWLPGGSALFGEAYRLYIGDPSRFSTTLRDPQTGRTVNVDLAGVTNAEVAVNVEQNPVNGDVLAGIRTLRALGPRQSIRYLDGEDTAVLVPVFFRDTFTEFLKEAFAGLKSKGTKNLIIDMRGNTGGFDVLPGLLFSYLTSKEFRSNEPNYIKTLQPSFKQYTDLPEIDPVTDTYFGSDAGIWKPDPNGGWLMTEKYPMVGVRKPSENHFDGPVYVLIDGGTISAGSDFCATANFYKRATFIGEETGGAAEGSGGADIGPTLPESHLHIGIPIEWASIVVDKSTRRRGTMPKHPVTQTIDDLAKGRDTVLEFTRKLIRSGKGHLTDQFKKVAGGVSETAAVADAPDIISIPEKELASLAGLYFDPITMNSFRFYMKDGKLSGHFNQLPGFVLSPLSQNRFKVVGVPLAEFVFIRPIVVGPMQVKLIFSGTTTTYDAVQSETPTPTQLAEFTGKYVSDELPGATYTLSINDGKLVLEAMGRKDILLTPAVADAFITFDDGDLFIMRFTRNPQNAVSGFTITTETVRRLRFNKQ